MVEGEPVVCAICGETAKKVGNEYECSTCKKIFWISPKKETCSNEDCSRTFLDFKSMADKIQNWIGISKRGLWKNLCPTHRRDMFDGIGTVCEVIQYYLKEEGYTPRDFEADLPEELIKLCLLK